MPALTPVPVLSSSTTTPFIVAPVPTVLVICSWLPLLLSIVSVPESALVIAVPPSSVSTPPDTLIPALASAPVLLSVTVTPSSVAPLPVAPSAPPPAVTSSWLPVALSTVSVPPTIEVPSSSVKTAPDTSMPVPLLRSLTATPSSAAAPLTRSSPLLEIVSVPPVRPPWIWVLPFSVRTPDATSMPALTPVPVLSSSTTTPFSVAPVPTVLVICSWLPLLLSIVSVPESALVIAVPPSSVSTPPDTLIPALASAPVLLSVTVTPSSVAPLPVAPSAPPPAVTSSWLPVALSTVSVPPTIEVPSSSVKTAPETSMPVPVLRSLTATPSSAAAPLTRTSPPLAIVSVPAVRPPWIWVLPFSVRTPDAT